MSSLKENDIAVLNYIFDPNITGKFNISVPLEENIPLEEDYVNDRVSEVREVEVEGIRLAEDGKLSEAIELFTRALEVAQDPSVYNNRAQAHRLMEADTNAMSDLNKALELSGRRGRVGCKALCQRALLYRKLGEEEKAKADFTAAAQLGSDFAKKQLVEMNPYAAMCNQMMHHMLFQRKEV